jgi:BCCIP
MFSALQRRTQHGGLNPMRRPAHADSGSESLGQGGTRVDFDFDDPAEPDFHIIKALCQKLRDGGDFDSSTFADAIIDKVRCARPAHRLRLCWRAFSRRMRPSVARCTGAHARSNAGSALPPDLRAKRCKLALQSTCTASVTGRDERRRRSAR